MELQEKIDLIEKTKRLVIKEATKHLHKMSYENGYLVEALPKASLLSLEKLVTYRDILLNNSENAVGVSDVEQESGVSHDVSLAPLTEDTTTTAVESALASTPETEKECEKVDSTNSRFEYMCDKCDCFLSGKQSCKAHRERRQE